MKAIEVKKAIDAQADPVKADFLPRFFKTGKGEYGEGDVFVGVTVPKIRKVARQYKDLAHSEVLKLLKSKVHEHRLCGLIIWVHQFEKGDEKTRKRIYTDYLKNTKYINNWDLVDVTTPRTVGVYVLEHAAEFKTMKKFAKSPNLWKRRIAMLAMFPFIRAKKFKEVYEIADILVHDTHDLIHKAVGWMLREAGKRDPAGERAFLRKHLDGMPRTMLRYAIEKFPEEERKAWLRGDI